MGGRHLYRLEHHGIESDGSGGQVRLLAAGQLGQVSDQAGQLIHLGQDVVDQDLSLCGSSSSRRRATSMLVRRLVSGVRSSCEASSTSWR